MSSQQIIDKILSHVDRLPELPAVALQVYRLLDDPNIRSQDLAKVIMNDPALTTKVLKLCNSAEYGFSRKIATISEAVSILGYQEIKRIVFVILSHSFLNRPVKGYALEKGALWENSLTCATYAQYISDKVNFKSSELAFIAALLRDIGKIAMESYIDGKGGTLEDIAKEQKCSFEEAEEKMIGASHTDVGSQLAIKWNLPESLVKTIEFHHHPSQLPADTSTEDRKLVCIIHLADIFTMMSGKGVGIDGLMYPLDPEVFKVLSIQPDVQTVERLYSDLLTLQTKVNSLSSSFDGQGA